MTNLHISVCLVLLLIMRRSAGDDDQQQRLFQCQIESLNVKSHYGRQFFFFIGTLLYNAHASGMPRELSFPVADNGPPTPRSLGQAQQNFFIYIIYWANPNLVAHNNQICRTSAHTRLGHTSHRPNERRSASAERNRQPVKAQLGFRCHLSARAENLPAGASQQSRLGFVVVKSQQVENESWRPPGSAEQPSHASRIGRRGAWAAAPFFRLFPPLLASGCHARLSGLGVWESSRSDL